MQPDRPPSSESGPAEELDFHRIREQVAARAAAPTGADRVRGAGPLATRAEAESELEAVTQMGVYLAERSESIFPCFFDGNLVGRLKIERVLLDREDFLAVRKTLDAVADLKRRAQLPLTAHADRIVRTLAQLPALDALLKELNRVFSPDGEIQDRASEALHDLRRNRRGLVGSIETGLRHLLRDAKLEKHLSEGYFTQANGRYVVLVRSDAKGHVPGIVQGQSKSGVSLYVEPLALVERNNELVRSFLEEEAEIARILAKLSAAVRSRHDELSMVLELMTWLDSLAARARWSQAHAAHAPEFTGDFTFELRRARHPLLGERCIPIDMRTGPADRVLVLGGANSGGKTVALKTVGLLHLMARAGFPIPCDDGSRVAFFGSIFCEIGDKQSIDANLSSFSSHVSDVAAILRQARRGDLVLLDEFMTGTDPQEGSALAEAVLMELAARGTLTIITTHYNSIKLLKDRYPGFKNYAVEFDWRTLQPTYRLLENEYGASAGIEIASRFGLPDAQTGRARELLEGPEGNVAAVISRLEAERTRARQDREQHQHLVHEAERLRADYEKQLSELKEERRVRLGKQLREERLELSALRDYVREAVRTGQFKAATEALEERAEIVEKHEESIALPLSTEPVQVGDRVLVLDLNVEGEVLGLGSRHATVQLETGVPLKTRPQALRKLAGHKPKRLLSGRVVVEAGGSASYSSDAEIPLELNLIQLRAEEAKERLAWYLDRASARGLKEVRIVHGKGDGILRRVVEEFLKGSVYAREWRAGGLGEGDSGVTIVKLAE